MGNEAPAAWNGIGRETKVRMTIQDALGAQIAIGNGALLGTNSGTFWAAGGLEVASALAAFIQVDNARPIPLKRFYWPGGEGIEYAFEV